MSSEEPSLESVQTRASYQNLQFHAAGGLGEVYRASDANLRRDVALKFIQRRHFQNTEYLDLFYLEAEITSRLDHPGVVPVYGVGEAADSRPFYAMRYIEGAPLREDITRYHQSGRLPAELHKLLAHLVTVCKTAAYAHNRGVVHCDIKPENIMLGKYGETLLVDWGLATTVERDERARASGEKTMRIKSSKESGKSSGGAAGTVGFMSPEQHPGFQRPLSPASDIYSLGATLYCVLTNQAPLEGAEETLLLDKLRWGEFPRPIEIRPDTPAPLEAVCLKAMAKHPAERYASALEMAEDLEAWLADESVSVYRESLLERGLRWGRRHLHWMIAGMIAALLVLLVATGSAWQLGASAAKEIRARREAEQARSDAEAARALAEAARQRALVAQQNGMRLTAGFAARAVGSQILWRWKMLSEAAADPQLEQLILVIEDHSAVTPEQRQLQSWLEAQRRRYPSAADSWFLTDARGIQIARDPLNEQSLFQYYAGRTYFHGGPRNLSGTEAQQEVKPISVPTISSVYQSTATKTLKVAFSVPVWKGNVPDGTCLGVLGMSVELGEFSELQTGLDAGQVAVLVDTRADQTEASPATGLILHHPDLQEARAHRRAAGESAAFRLPPRLVERIQHLEQRTLAEGRLPAELDQSLELNYVDPLAAGPVTPVMASFAPVRVEIAPHEFRPTGWAVLVQESPHDDVVAPASATSGEL